MMRKEDSSWNLMVGCAVASSLVLLRILIKSADKRKTGKVDADGERRRLCHASQVGSRGQKALSPPIPYLNQFLVCLQNECHHVRNPKGHIALCVAENKQVQDLLKDRVLQMGTTSATFSHDDVYCYSTFLGMPVARKASAYFLARRFLCPDDPDLTPDKAFSLVDPRHIALSSGAAAVLNSLFFTLGEKGDSCLIPAPYYAAFENDMAVVAEIVPVAVEQENPVSGPTELELEQAYKKSVKSGHKPRFLLLTNPNNPLGTIYSAAQLKRVVAWARGKRMHIIVDEIYALGTHKPNNFQSILKVLDNKLGNDVHFVWALSKDFGGSGLRVGILYSQNEVFLDGMATLNIFSAVSGPIQYLCAELLTDDFFVDKFLQESRRRVLSSYNLCASKLEEMVIPFVHAEAGLFVYVDFSSLLPKKTFEYEAKLSKIVFEYARIVMTPGESQRETKAGMFRICYAWVSPEVLVIAMERLSRIVAKLRRLDWDDLHERSLAGIIQ